MPQIRKLATDEVQKIQQRAVPQTTPTRTPPPHAPATAARASLAPAPAPRTAAPAAPAPSAPSQQPTPPVAPVASIAPLAAVAPEPLPAETQDVRIVLHPVELPNAARRGDTMHLTLGAGITLCATPCDETPQGGRAYLVASGCQRCAWMLPQLQARCATCGHPVVHLTGTGACIFCGSTGTTIRLP